MAIASLARGLDGDTQPPPFSAVINRGHQPIGGQISPEAALPPYLVVPSQLCCTAEQVRWGVEPPALQCGQLAAVWGI
jgi:hypothetical protein